MDGALEVGRYVGLLVLLVVTLALFGAQNAAGASRTPVQHAPTLLWRTYPLVQHATRVSFRPPALSAGAPRGLPLEAQSGTNAVQSETLLLLLVGSLVAAFAGLLMIRSALAELRGQTGSRKPRNRS